jgi:hypothetical protein
MPEPVTLTIIAVTSITLALIGYRTVEKIADVPGNTVVATKEVIQCVCDQLRDLFGAKPRFSVDKEVTQVADPVAICELCLASTKIKVVAKFENSWAKSTKRIECQQTFLVKAGYDLNRLKLDFDTNKKCLRVTISEATIVNVIPDKLHGIKAISGFLNWVKEEERVAVLNSLPQIAKNEAKRSEVYALAAKQLKVVMERMLKPFAYSVEVIRLDDAIVFEDTCGLREMPEQAKQKLELTEDVILSAA